MANISVKVLKDKNQEAFVPFTITDAVFVPDTNKTVTDLVDETIATLEEAMETIPTKTSDLTNDSGFIDNTVDNLVNYTLSTGVGTTIDMSINTTTYVLTLSLKNSDGTVLSTDTVDLPIESMVVNATYDTTNKKIILTLQSGTTIDVPIGDIVSGLQTEITASNKLNSDLVDDINSTNKFVTTNEKSTWNAKYDKPNTGIPSTDLDNAVQTSLGKADTALQTESDPVFGASPAAGITANDIGNWNNKSNFSGDYNDLTNKPTIPTSDAIRIDSNTTSAIIMKDMIINKVYQVYYEASNVPVYIKPDSDGTVQDLRSLDSTLQYNDGNIFFIRTADNIWHYYYSTGETQYHKSIRYTAASFSFYYDYTVTSNTNYLLSYGLGSASSYIDIPNSTISAFLNSKKYLYIPNQINYELDLYISNGNYQYHIDKPEYYIVGDIRISVKSLTRGNGLYVYVPTQYGLYIGLIDLRAHAVTDYQLPEGDITEYTDYNASATQVLSHDSNGDKTWVANSSGGSSAIDSISVNGTTQTIDANKNVDITVPTTLSSLSDDSTHRVVTDTEKTTWNNKSNFSGSYNDLTNKPNLIENINTFNVITSKITFNDEVALNKTFTDRDGLTYPLYRRTFYIPKDVFTFADNSYKVRLNDSSIDSGYTIPSGLKRAFINQNYSSLISGNYYYPVYVPYYTDAQFRSDNVTNLRIDVQVAHKYSCYTMLSVNSTTSKLFFMMYVGESLYNYLEGVSLVIEYTKQGEGQ
jgi:hypothetical protein